MADNRPNALAGCLWMFIIASILTLGCWKAVELLVLAVRHFIR